MNPDNTYKSESVWNDKPLDKEVLAGGGGRSGSNAAAVTPGFDRPSYQFGPGIAETETKRLVPDVAFVADQYPGWTIYCTAPGCYPTGWETTAGTSADAPFLTAALALIDQRLEAEGVPRIGELNPVLYSLARTQPSVFHDVTVGDNIVVDEPVTCCTARRFDLASGWGSIDLGAFADALAVTPATPLTPPPTAPPDPPATAVPVTPRFTG